jgi:predicted ester cyclase
VENLKEVVRSFSTDCVTVNTHADDGAIVNRLLADSFQSIGSADTKGKAQLTGQVQFFRKLIPDLKWEFQEMLQDGNKVVVTSTASGSPEGDFMGLNLDGSKSFKIMTIDIHRVEQNQITQAHYLEDWPTAIKQMKGRSPRLGPNHWPCRDCAVADELMRAERLGERDDYHSPGVSLCEEDVVE